MVLWTLTNGTLDTHKWYFPRPGLSAPENVRSIFCVPLFLSVLVYFLLILSLIRSLFPSLTVSLFFLPLCLILSFSSGFFLHKYYMSSPSSHLAIRVKPAVCVFLSQLTTSCELTHLSESKQNSLCQVRETHSPVLYKKANSLFGLHSPALCTKKRRILEK